MTSQTPIDITSGMLNAFARKDTATALEFIDDNIVYTNVSLPAMRGKRKVAKLFGSLEKSTFVSFNYQMINVASEGPVVLTERIDELRYGRVHIQFWVCGRFEIRDARIVVWRDYFDYFDMTKALLRGLVGAVIPAVARPLPAPLPA